MEQQLVWYAGKQILLEVIQLTNDADRRTVAENTLRWWQAAHRDNTPYHQTFKGYCTECLVSKA